MMLKCRIDLNTEIVTGYDLKRVKQNHWDFGIKNNEKS